MPGKKKKKVHKDATFIENCTNSDVKKHESCAILPGVATVPSSNYDIATESTFQQELDWCIGQLELGLLRQDASKAQKEQSRRYIRTLKSPKNPLPRRRQLMRQLFGDYRTKMKSKHMPQKPKLETTSPTIATTDKQKLLSSGKFYKPCVKQDPKPSTSTIPSDNLSPFMFMFDVTDCS